MILFDGGRESGGDVMTDWSDIEQRIIRIYGTDLRRDSGVIHVTSVWAESARSLITLRIGKETPRSATDRFALNVARARADAIVTTGEILRSEDGVTHDLQGVDDTPRALADWRRERLGKSVPPLSAVLTSGRDIDLDHPLFKSGTVPAIFTSSEGAERVRGPASSRGIEIVDRPAPCLRDAVSYLRENRGAASIVIEAGPSSSRTLYESPVVVDELMLSIYSGSQLPRSVRGKPFMSVQQLGLLFPLAARTYPSEEESGPWVFRRYKR
jgi:riboflavin biosynthesis pyrimidine reductase